MLTLSFVVFAATTAAAEPGFDAASVWITRCGVCHTVGGGDAIGPDLAGVTDRRERAWLIAFIRSSQAVIQRGDPTAREIYERFGRTTMPDHPYTDEQIETLLTLIDQGGPPKRETIRLARSATADDVAAGRELFYGHRSREVSCAACHSLDGGSIADRLYLGGSLKHAFSRYQDRELDAKLSRSEAACPRALPADDSFAVRAFLRHAEGSEGGRRMPLFAFPLLGGGAGLLLLAGGRRGASGRSK